MSQRTTATGFFLSRGSRRRLADGLQRGIGCWPRPAFVPLAGLRGIITEMLLQLRGKSLQFCIAHASGVSEVDVRGSDGRDRHIGVSVDSHLEHRQFFIRTRRPDQREPTHHHENPGAHGSGLFCQRHAGQINRERRAFARPRVDVQGPAAFLDEPLDNVEPEPVPSRGPLVVK